MARLSHRVCAGFLGADGGWCCWLGWVVVSAQPGVRESVESLDRAGDHVCPGPVKGESQVSAAGGGDELRGGAEEAKP